MGYLVSLDCRDLKTPVGIQRHLEDQYKLGYTRLFVTYIDVMGKTRDPAVIYQAGIPESLLGCGRH